MFLKARLACSFCGKSDSQVAKLVAGPKVYICDACVAAASRVMSDFDGAIPDRPSRWVKLLQRLADRLSRLRGWCKYRDLRGTRPPRPRQDGAFSRRRSR
jgi:ClpX C4-type zinc finger